MPKTQKPPPEPDDLVRESAGAYRSGDGRFAVSQSDASWFIVDTEQVNELGQELIHGPFSSMKQAREAIPGARSVKPLLRSRPRPKRPAKTAPAPKPPPKSWIDRLAEPEQREVRRLIRALEAEGVADAEVLVRRHRDDDAPLISTRLIEHRLRQLVELRPPAERDAALEIVRGVVKILSVDGLTTAPPLGRWSLTADTAADEASAAEPTRTIRLRV